MRTKWTILAAALLTTPVMADDPPVVAPCDGPAALVCAALALPVAVALVDKAIDAACPGAYPPGQWPEEALAARPAYPEQWYRECERDAD